MNGDSEVCLQDSRNLKQNMSYKFYLTSFGCRKISNYFICWIYCRIVRWCSKFSEDAMLTTLGADECELWYSFLSCLWDFLLIFCHVMWQESIKVAQQLFVSKWLRTTAGRALNSIQRKQAMDNSWKSSEPIACFQPSHARSSKPPHCTLETAQNFAERWGGAVLSW